MQFPTRSEVESLRKRYPVGAIVEVDYMDDPQAPAPGTRGTITAVDDIGQLHCKEFGLALVPGVDRFHKIAEE